MKRKLLSLFALFLMATSVGWAEDKLQFEGTESDVTDFKSYMGIKDTNWKGHIIYGNGYAITIEKTSGATAENQVTITFKGEGAPEPIQIKDTEHAVIFGGSKEADLAGSTSITLKSGDVGYLIGGGWGTRGKNTENPKTANVSGDVTLDVQGGSVGLIFSGGLYRSNVNDITLNVKGAKVGHIYCGGFDQGQTSNTLDTEWASSVNHVNKSTLIMEDSEVSGYLFLGGGQGYSYSKEVIATVSNSTLRGGILGTGSNGRSDKVAANVIGCTFEKASNEGALIEIAPLNRGIIKDITMLFENCIFPENKADYAAYLGATYGYDGNSRIELGSVSLTFKGGTHVPDMCVSSGLDNASVTLAGAKAIIGETITKDDGKGNLTKKSSYTLGAGKNWTFNNGLEFVEDATLTKNGTLVVKGTYGIVNANQLKEAITTIGENGIVEAKTLVLTVVLSKIKTTLPAGILIICKDAYLFDSKAKAEACTETDQPVFYTTGEAGSYTIVQVLKAAETYYVSSTAQSKGTGLTAESPLMSTSLTEAISKATKEVKLTGEFTAKIVLDKAITLSSADVNSKATINGTIAITAEDATVENLKLAYQWVSSKYDDKIGISVFANKAILKGNTFTTSGGTNATNGIVFYPKAATADYTVTGNTFNLSVAGSTAIVVREDFLSKTQIPDVSKTAKLTNGAALDANIAGANTYTNIEGGAYYMRITGNYSELDATGSGSDAVTQKTLYAYVAKDAVADAVQSAQAGSTVKVDDTAVNMLAGMNGASDKTALTSNITIICSDETVYTDLTSALTASTAEKKAKYVALDGGTYKLVEAEKVTPVITAEGLKASDVEVGQALSASLLSGGAATVDSKAVSGTFSWKDAKAEVSAEGPTSFAVIFTPTDQLKYNVVETTASVKGIQYYVVKAGKCENGKVVIDNANAENRYKKDTKLTVTTVADAHYKFKAWIKGAASYTVAENAELTASFEAITRKVTFGEGVTVLNNGVAVTNNAQVIEGATLTVTATKAGNQLTALTCNDQNIINNTLSVKDKDLTIAATFAAIPASTQLVTVDYGSTDSKNGKVQLFDEKGNIIESGAAVTVGKKVTVVAVPDYGYVSNQLSVTGATLTLSTFTVASEAVTVKQTFKKVTYKVTLPVESTEHATIKLSSTELDAIPYLTSLTVSSATASKGYALVAIIVNGKEVVVDGSFKVTADTKVNAVVKALPQLQFTDTEQTYTYTGKEQTFVVRTIPAGVEGVTISYKQNNGVVETPTAADTYDVFASYTGDKYTVQKEAIGTLEIKKAPYMAAIPTLDQVGNGYTKLSEEGEMFQKVRFDLTPELQVNYETPTFIIPKAGVTVTEVSLSSTTETSKQASLSTRASGTIITLKGINGAIVAYNGPTETTTAYEGQTITLKATPDAGFSSIPSKWETTTGTITDNHDGTATVKLPSQDATITAIFASKGNAPVATGKTAAGKYNGIVYGGATIAAVDSKLQGWNLFFKQGETTINEPVAAGSYDMIASRSEDEAYAATSTKIGTLTIAKAMATISDVKGSDIQIGDELSKSVLSGVSDVEGTFTWEKADQAMNTAGNAIQANVLFTTANSNYANATGQATLKVIAKSADVKTRTLALTVNNPSNGEAVKMTLDGTEVTSGTAVKEGSKLIVTFKANTGSTATAKINNAAYTSGSTYTIGADGDVNIVVTYTKNSTPGGGDDGEDEEETPSLITIALDASEKTLKVGDEFTLKATVTGSTDKVVWTSSDDKVATVTEGKVKAVKAGAATITATIGQVKAECKVTVTAPTGLEEVLADSRIYGAKGMIVIEPAATMQVGITNLTGYHFYADEVSNVTRVSIPAGIYLVSFSDGKQKVTIKVSVR